MKSSMKNAARYSSDFASGEVSLVTATMCLDGSSPASFSAFYTNVSLVSVSSVVPDFETSTNRLCFRSIDFSTFAASLGSTLLIKRASSRNAPFSLAQFSSARYMARGPRSLPPIPICTTVVNFSPSALAISHV